MLKPSNVGFTFIQKAARMHFYLDDGLRMPLKNDLAWVIRRRFLPKPARICSSDHFDGEVVVAGLFSTANGIGRSARLHFAALKSEGVNPQAIDLSSLFGVADYNCEIPFKAKIEPGNVGTLLLCLNPVEAEAALYSTSLRNARNWRIIGNWVWELPRAPSRWTYLSRMYSEIWVPSEFVAQAQKVDVPIKIVPLCIPVVELPNESVGTKTGLNFLIAADGWSSFERKNVLGAVRAYKMAFPEILEHSLVVKCRNLKGDSEFGRKLAEEVEFRDDITVHSRTVTDVEMQNLIQDADVIISLHRSEGYGLVLAEAMMREKVVIASNWSGNLQFMNEHNSILIECDFVPVNDPFGVYQSVDSCLLYTSPSPRDATLSRMPSSA